MAVRIDRDSITAQATSDPAVHLITAAVTTDPDTIKNPALRTYTVKWNENTGCDGLLTLFQEKADKESSAVGIVAGIKEAIGEDLSGSSTDPTTEQDPATVIINAASVTVNQVV
jgi:hypothetical protein